MPNKYYWQPVPVKKVYFPAYTTNTAATNALFSGQIDWTGNFIQGLKKDFIDKDPTHHIGWENAGATNVLIPNMTTWPTNQLAVRQAISAAIDRTAIGKQGEDGQIIASELKAAGINATFYGTSTPAIWNTDLANGNFQLAMHWGNGGISPYNMYDNWMDHTLVQGANTSGDYGRLNDPQVQAMLAKIAGDQTTAQQQADFQPLLKYVADNLPVIQTVNSAQWFEANSQHFTGWPSPSNPYETGQPSGSNNGPGPGTDEVVILHLTPVA